MLYIASDHAGFELKEKIKKFLEEKKVQYQDIGPFQFDPNDDYPDYAVPLVQQVGQEPDYNKGILICRNGVGMSIVANKFAGIRAALSWEPKHAASARTDDNANVLCLPADYISEGRAKNTVAAFLDTPFSQDQRHRRRLEKVAKVGG